MNTETLPNPQKEVNDITYNIERDPSYDELMAKIDASMPTPSVATENFAPHQGNQPDYDTNPDNFFGSPSIPARLMNSVTGRPLRPTSNTPPAPTAADLIALDDDQEEDTPPAPTAADLIALDDDQEENPVNTTGSLDQVPAATKEEADRLAAQMRGGSQNNPPAPRAQDRMKNQNVSQDIKDATAETMASNLTHDELKQRVEDQMAVYATETAKSRKSYLGRFASSKGPISKLLNKTPGIKQIIQGLNSNNDQKVLDAKANYELLHNSLGAQVAEQRRNEGASEHEIMHESTIGNIEADYSLENEIAFRRMDLSKDTNTVVDMWVNANGYKKILKAGVVTATGAGAGIAAGLLLAPLTAAAAAGATGMGIAKYIGDRRANANIYVDDNSSEPKTLAVQESEKDYQEKSERYIAQHSEALNAVEQGDAPTYSTVETSTEHVESKTSGSMAGNRNRVVKSAKLALLGAGIGPISEVVSNGAGIVKNSAQEAYEIISGIDPNVPDISVTDFTSSLEPISDRSAFSSIGTDTIADTATEISRSIVDAAENNLGDLAEPNARLTQVPDGSTATGDILSNGVDLLGEFQTGNGEGITHGIMELANANGAENITPEQARDLVRLGVERLGADNLITNETYTMPNGQPGISSTGPTSFTPEFAQLIADTLN